jgi:hypothetical protein
VRLLKTDLPDLDAWSDCLEQAILSDSAPLVEAIVSIPGRPKFISREYFKKARSKEVRVLLAKSKACDPATMLYLVADVLEGRVELDLELLIDLIVKSTSTSTHPAGTFQLMARYNLVDGVGRLLEAFPLTRNWRKVAETGNRIGNECSGDIFYDLLSNSSKFNDTSMFEMIYSMIRPYPEACRRAMRGVKMMHINPRIFLKYYGPEWFSADDLPNQTRDFVDPGNRQVVNDLLFRLASLLYLDQENSAATAAKGESTYGKKLAIDMLTGASPAWMREVKRNHDEMIDIMLQQLPKDLVIMSLHYYVGC